MAGVHGPQAVWRAWREGQPGAASIAGPPSSPEAATGQDTLAADLAGTFAHLPPPAAPGAALTVLSLGADTTAALTPLFAIGLNPRWRDGRYRPLHWVLFSPLLRSSTEAGVLADATGIRRAGWFHRLRDAWPVRCQGLHPVPGVNEGAGSLTWALGDPGGQLARLPSPADLLFADPATLARWFPDPRQAATTIARALAPGGTLVLAGGREAPSDTGLRAWIERGFVPVGSRDGTPPSDLGVYQRRGREPARSPCDTVRRPPGQALVIGAGLAGAASAAALAARDWSVVVLDARPNAVGFAPGGAQPALADHLHLSVDDNPTARLSRHALWRAAAWRDAGPAPVGRLQLAADPAAMARQQSDLAALGFDPALVSWADAAEASARAGLTLPRGGLWMPGCGTADPARLCRRWLDAPGRIRSCWSSRVESLEGHDDRWIARGADGAALAEGDVVILANAGDALRLAGNRHPVLQRRRGQSTRVEGGPLGALRTVLGAGMYACPLGEGSVLIGPGLNGPDTLEPDLASERHNLQRVAEVLPGLSPAALAGQTRGAHVGWRYAAPDRLPCIGPMPDDRGIAWRLEDFHRNDRLALPRLPGLYGHFALGARGLLWSTLGAEVLAWMIAGGPAPLEADLLRAIDPARFTRQRLRQGLGLG